MWREWRMSLLITCTVLDRVCCGGASSLSLQIVQFFSIHQIITFFSQWFQFPMFIFSTTVGRFLFSNHMEWSSVALTARLGETTVRDEKIKQCNLKPWKNRYSIPKPSFQQQFFTFSFTLVTGMIKVFRSKEIFTWSSECTNYVEKCGLVGCSLE